MVIVIPSTASDFGEGMPVTRISEIVSASPLSDDDIQQLVSVLLEKMNTNSEWEAVSWPIFPITTNSVFNTVQILY